MKTAEDGSSGVNGARGRRDDYEKQYCNCLRNLVLTLFCRCSRVAQRHCSVEAQVRRPRHHSLHSSHSQGDATDPGRQFVSQAPPGVLHERVGV